MKDLRDKAIRVATVIIAIVLTLAGFGGVANAGISSGSGTSTAAADPITTVTATLGDDMRITLDRYSAPAGDVRFLVSNLGHATHELVVLKTDLAADSLVADPDVVGKVEEELHMGETGDVSGERFSGLQLRLGPGSYVIICNEIGHYMAGMHVAFTVTQPIVNVTLDDSMTMTLDRTLIYTGPIVFGVTNRGSVTHEFVVLATSTSPDEMQADPEEAGKISEDTNIGETGDIPAGRYSGLGLDLAPGVYTVICNEPGHFSAGMHLTLIILPAPGGDE